LIRADATVHLSKGTLDRIATGRLPLRDAIEQGAVQIQGNAAAVAALFRMMDRFAPDFPIMTPARLP
jgi:alkyl sulfatase BDS1-like metallo-beta-lactamase superfamily hydrolase